jgi:capsule polysaccharide export protein KpsE/RkpR
MRIDSVRRELSREMSDAASVQDQNQNAAVARVRIPLQKKQLNIQLLTTLYGELVKNIELSKMSLVKEEPLIEIIDSPTLPLKFVKKSRLLTGIVYGISGVFVAIIYFILLVFYRDFKAAVRAEIGNDD